MIDRKDKRRRGPPDPPLRLVRHLHGHVDLRHPHPPPREPPPPPLGSPLTFFGKSARPPGGPDHPAMTPAIPPIRPHPVTPTQTAFDP